MNGVKAIKTTEMENSALHLWVPIKNIPPKEGQWKFQRGGMLAKAKLFEAMYGAELEFLEGWNSGEGGGWGHFLETHIVYQQAAYLPVTGNTQVTQAINESSIIVCGTDFDIPWM